MKRSSALGVRGDRGSVRCSEAGSLLLPLLQDLLRLVPERLHALGLLRDVLFTLSSSTEDLLRLTVAEEDCVAIVDSEAVDRYALPLCLPSASDWSIHAPDWLMVCFDAKCLVVQYLKRIFWHWLGYALWTVTGSVAVLSKEPVLVRRRGASTADNVEESPLKTWLGSTTDRHSVLDLDGGCSRLVVRMLKYQWAPNAQRAWRLY